MQPGDSQEKYRAARKAASPDELVARLVLLVEADPDFEVINRVDGTKAAFRAAPMGLEQSALDRLNADLYHRVRATSEVELEWGRIDGNPWLLIGGLALGAVEGGAERTWDVISDEFRGLLIESSDQRLRWDLSRRPASTPDVHHRSQH
jgi:hypothetical protein